MGWFLHSLTLRLPFPPSLNHIWRVFGRRIILSAVAREWSVAAVNSMPEGRVPPPFTGRLVVTLLLRPPASYGKRKWDIANREKLLCDLLTKQRVWLDDEQIDVLLIVRGAAATDKGYVDILVQEL